MKTKRLLSRLAAVAALASGLTLSAQTIKTWTGGNGDFFDPTHWDAGIPVATDIAVINNASTGTIGATAGDRAFGTIRLGDVQGGTESGHVIMNGGTLTIGGTAGDPKAVIGASGTLSTFIQNGGTIIFDGPDAFPGSTTDDGLNGLDWEVGEFGLGRFEMHSNAVFRAGDDLKVAENAAGAGSVLIDGNARLSVGSGISISSGGTNEQTMVIGGNAVVDSGNSMGAGDPRGSTDEGYLTMAIGNGVGKLTIQDNGILNIRRLSAREGKSTIIVEDHGQFHIFNVLAGAGTNAATRPAEPGIGSDNNNSTYGSANTSDATLILQDDAQMTVSSAPEAGTVKGLGISAPRAAGNPGGKAILRIQDRASFRLEQDLSLGTGADAETSDGTLEVVGPNASVNIAGNLNMAVDLEGNVAGTDDGGTAAPGKSTLSAVITGTNHTTVNVGGIARIGQGRLKVTLNGNTPVEGQTYTLIKGGTINGTFASTDYSAATLPQGLSWQVEYAADAVRLKVVSQPGLPGAPGDNGLAAKTDTIYVNTPDTVNNGNTESLGVTIADNGNVMVGWEDDHAEDTSLQYIAAAWTLYNSTGAPITPATQQNSTAVGGSTTNRFLSYFRTDGSAIPPFTSWGPKIKADPFGEGLGMGGTSYALGMEVPEFAAIQNNAIGENAGDFPSVQLLSSTGGPVAIVSGVPDAYAERDGDIRIADWDFLANGNVVVVGESRQRDDLVSVYGGSGPQTHAIYRIVNRTGNEVKAVSLASELAEAASEMWHGAAATRNGFALRFGYAGRATVRLFNNDGTPASTNIDLATLTGQAITAGGGRGDGVGFHGNGNDAYVATSVGTDERGTNAVWITVLNANGTVRYSKSVSDDVAITGIGRSDAAIDDTGRVLAVWDAQIPFDDGAGNLTNVRLVMGRLLDPAGNPSGGTFYVSEKELPVIATQTARNPRAALRGGLAAVTWESQNAGVPERVVALRLFGAATNIAEADLTLTVERAGASSIRLSWSGGTGPFLVQKKSSLGDTNWMNVLTTAETTALVPNDGTTGFFRVQSGATTTVIPFSAYMGAIFEKPNTNASTATGIGTFSIEGNTLSYDIAYTGLTAAASAAHIHGFGTTTQAVGVAIGFTGLPTGTSGRIKGTATLSEEQRTNILAGRTYANIHTPSNTGGEIRGQIAQMNLRATLNGANERPTPVTTPATGTGKFTLVGNELFVDLSYTGLQGAINNSHIHGPATTELSVGVLVPMNNLHVGPFGTSTAGRFEGSVVLSPQHLSHIIDGLTYFNIHSASFTGGEIRGQIVP